MVEIGIVNPVFYFEISNPDGTFTASPDVYNIPTFLDLYFGAMPGLSGMVGLAILLPFTFDMNLGFAFALLLGMFAITTTSDTIASVLLAIPGTVSSQATVSRLRGS